MQCNSCSSASMESDSASDNSSDGSFVEDGSSNDEESSSDVDTFDCFYCDYLELVEGIRRKHVKDECLRIQRREIFRALLHDIERICRLLTCETLITRVSLGDVEGLEWPKLLITTDNKAALQKFSSSIGGLQHLRSLKLGGYTLNAEAMVEVLRCMPPALEEIEIHLPWFDIRGDYMATLVGSLSNHPCQAISLELNGKIPDAASDSVRSVTADKEILSQLLRLNGLKELSLHSLDLTLEECKLIANMLSSNACPVEFLHINTCLFPEDGSRLIAESVQSNTCLKRLVLTDMLQDDDTFSNALLVSLPLNESIEEFKNTFLVNQVCSTMIGLIKNIARLNTTIKYIHAMQPLCSPPFSDEEILEIRQALQENYTLEGITIGYERHFSTITRLNQAGRRYIVQGHSASKSKCIGVLANPVVNDNLDCLYFHLRENPVLFTGDGNHEKANRHNNNKRKVDGAQVQDGGKKRAST